MMPERKSVAYKPPVIRSVRLGHHGANVLEVFGRFFAWIGDLEHPHYISHALTEDRAIALLSELHENQTPCVETLKEKVCMYAVTVLHIHAHPSGERVYLGVIGGSSQDCKIAFARSKEACLLRLEQIFTSG